MSEETLFNELRKLEDFECYPLPSHWYKKYGIEPVKAGDPKSFMESNYTQKCSVRKTDLSPLIIDEPQQNGKTWDLLPEEKVKIETITRPYKAPKGTLVTMPYYKELEEKELEEKKNQA